MSQVITYPGNMRSGDFVFAKYDCKIHQISAEDAYCCIKKAPKMTAMFRQCSVGNEMMASNSTYVHVYAVTYKNLKGLVNKYMVVAHTGNYFTLHDGQEDVGTKFGSLSMLMHDYDIV